MTTQESIATLIRISNCPDLPTETRRLAKECLNKILDVVLYEREKRMEARNDRRRG